MGNSKRDGFHVEQVKTGGGTYIEGGVHTGGGDSVFRDKIVYQGPAYPRLNYRSEITHLIEFYTQTFVGREQEWTELAGFARQKAPGYLLVEALPGYGKSALLAYLVHRWETGRWDQPPVPELLYFFIRQEGQRNTSVAFLQAINSQLLETLKLPGGVPTDLSALRGQFSQLWSQALEAANREKPLLLLVDGLDEIATGEVTIAHLLPANLAPYVHVVVASRPNPEPLQQVDLAHPFKKASVLRLYTFEEDDVRALLQKHGAVEEMAASLAPRVLTMTKGEPLFARFVCQEVADEGESALARLEKNPPADVEDYFGQQFKQLDTLAEGEHTWDILGLLVVALGGMTTDEIAEVLGLGRRQARKAVEPIMRFLLGETHLKLMHLQLRKVVAGEFSASEQAAYRQKLLDWCRSYEAHGWPDETPEYVLAHYARHLVEAGQREALYALIDKPWMDLKFEHTDSHRAFAEDVVLAIEVAGTEEPPNLVQVARGCLIYATLGSLAANVPPEVLGVLAQVGQVDKAQSYAALMRDPNEQIQAYRLIGEALLEWEDREEAGEILRQMLATAEAIGGEWTKACALSGVAQALAQAGEEDRAAEVANRALAAAEAIGDEWAKVDALKEMAQALAQTGEFDQALAAAEAIGEERAKADALSGVAQALAQAGEFDQALVAAEAIEKERTKADALSGVAQILARVGEKDRASEVANRALAAAEAIGDEWAKAHALSGMAQILVQVGEFDRALAAAEAIENKWRKADALSGVAQTEERDEFWAVVGMFEAFMEMMDNKVLALSGMAQALARVREFDQALVAVEAIGNGWAKADTLSRVAQALAQAGEKDGLNRALAAAEAIREEWGKACALSGVAQALAQVGEKARAAEVVDRALAAAKVIENEWRKADALSRAAQALAQTGEFDQALAAAKVIENEWRKADALSGVAQALAQAGEFDQALVAAEAIEKERTKADALSGVAQILARVGEKDRASEVANRALAAAEAVGGEWAKAHALSGMAQILVQVGEFDWALDVAEVIEHEWAKARVLSEVAQALAQAGEEDRVTEVANRMLAAAGKIGDKYTKVVVLNGVALALAQTGDKARAAEIANQALTVEAIGSERGEARALREVAQALAQAGEFDRAVAVTEAVRDEWAKADALSGVAQALAQAREKDRAAEIANWALAVTEAIGYGRPKARVLSEVAQALAQAGEFDRAVAVAIGGEYTKVDVLSEVALALAQTGEKARAAEIANQVLAAVEATGSGSTQAYVLSRVAQALAQIGEEDRATEVANRALAAAAEEMVPGEKIYNRVYVLSRVAQILIQAGEEDGLSRVLAVAEAIGHEVVKSSVLSEIAPILAQAGERDGLNQTLAVAEAIGDEQYRVNALSGVAQALVQAGEKERAVEVANRALAAMETIGDEQVKADVLREVALVLAQAGEEDRAAEVANQALAAAEAIWYEHDEVSVLSELTQALVQMGQQEQAQRVLLTAFTTARLAGRESVLKVLEHGATTLAALDQGQTLWRVYEAVMEVESWWSKRVLSDE